MTSGLGPCAFTAEARVASLVKGLRSHKACSVTKNKEIPIEISLPSVSESLRWSPMARRTPCLDWLGPGKLVLAVGHRIRVGGWSFFPEKLGYT